MMFGVVYWAIWELVLPYAFKFRLVPRKAVLEDGTVVTLVSRILFSWSERSWLTEIKVLS